MTINIKEPTSRTYYKINSVTEDNEYGREQYAADEVMRAIRTFLAMGIDLESDSYLNKF
jgi:hypothetical protein